SKWITTIEPAVVTSTATSSENLNTSRAKPFAGVNDASPRMGAMLAGAAEAGGGAASLSGAASKNVGNARAATNSAAPRQPRTLRATTRTCVQNPLAAARAIASRNLPVLSRRLAKL